MRSNDSTDRDIVLLLKENERLQTELASLSEKLNLSLSAGNLAWWEWDVANNIVSFNELKVTMLGYKIEDFAGVGYQAFTQLVHPDDFERTMQAMRDHLEGRAELYEVEYRILASDGTYKWYYDRGSVTERTPDGKPARLKGVVFDVSDRKRLEIEKDELIAELKAALNRVRKLEGILPICASCKSIRDEHGKWTSVDTYLAQHTDALMTHGLCPVCAKRLYPELQKPN